MSMDGCDTLVVGSGIAGLFTALEASRHGTVTVVTKGGLEESNTRYAQGGIAAAWSPDDSPALHEADTLAAGAGLSDPAAVRVMCEEAPARIADLLAYGVGFDRAAGGLARGLEAAHSIPRVLHAGGDATGARIETALAAALRAAGITVLEGSFVADLTAERGRVTGVEVVGPGGRRRTLRAQAVVLASGGAGQVFRHSTNPPIATGDGVAAAYRAGAVLSDLELFQFHPTALALPGAPAFLISEAVRGEGAVLRDARGRRFMVGLHPRAELAPRDVVARAIAARAAIDGQPALLDVTSLGADFLAARFPRIDAFCRSHGLDWSRHPVPVMPAAHYWMGGVATNTWGETSIPGLYACGEVACTGVHGANRLASNSLLEGIVFGARIALRLADSAPGGWEEPPFASLAWGAWGAEPRPGERRAPHSDWGAWGAEPTGAPKPPDQLSPARPGERRAPHSNKAVRSSVQDLAWDCIGLTRDAEGLSHAADQLASWEAGLAPPASVSEAEDANLVLVARLIAEAALARQESRGAHHRRDFPSPNPRWSAHLLVGLPVVMEAAR